MPNSQATNRAALMLELLELTSHGAVTAEWAAKRLRRSHPYARVARRVSTALAALAAEGLVESFREDGAELFRVTPSGLAALERRGRFPGAAAVLFTDIVGSTELIDRFGEDGAHERRQRHFAQLREAVAEHGGREVKSLGDGLMVIFSEPGPAAECAAAMQRAVAAGEDRLGLRVGLHAGELLREGNDFFGSTVIVARRLCDSAQSGGILASEEFVAVAGIDEDGVDALGPIALKGFADPVPASEVRWSREPEGRRRTPRLRFLREAAIAAAGG